VRPRKRFGQHFLEPAWVRKVVDVIAPDASQTLLEIGPGRGALTRPLAERAASVIAVEIDRDLGAALSAAAPPNTRVLVADFLGVDVAALVHESGAPPPVRVAGNLPFNVASPILFKLVEASDAGRLLADATLMLQREVADRLIAAPGSSEYGPLAILVQLRADVSRLMTLPPGAFRPAPRVSSAVVRLRFRPPAVAVSDAAWFAALVRGLFTRRRKTVLNALKPLLVGSSTDAAGLLAKVGIDAGRRPETLHLAELARLAERLFASAASRGVL